MTPDPLSTVGALSLDDIRRLKTARDRVLALMVDSKWHTANEIREIGGSEGLRRYRELRQRLSLKGWTFAKRRIDVSRGTFEYKAIAPISETEVDRGEGIESGEDTPGPNYTPDPDLDDTTQPSWWARNMCESCGRRKTGRFGLCTCGRYGGAK